MCESEALLDVWVQHFGKLAKSKVSELDGLRVLQQKMETLASSLFSNEEYVLDVERKEAERKKGGWSGWSDRRAPEGRTYDCGMVKEHP